MKSDETANPAAIIEFEGIPATSEDLLKVLDATLPHRCIAQTETEADARYYGAQRDLIDYLLVLLEEQKAGENDDGMESVITTIKR